MSNPQQTFTAQLTPRGRGAVATIRIVGNLQPVNQYFRAANQKTIQEQALDNICYGHWGNENAEDLVVTKLSNEELEVHCHGGEAAVTRILNDLTDAGATRTNSAHAAGPPVTFAAEFNDCLQQATTQQTAHHLLRQSILFPQAIEQLAQLSPRERCNTIEKMLAWKDFGLHLTQPWKVVLCGPPNVGKSSLINALVGYSRTVVYDQPGTTRDVISTQTAFAGWPIEFSDTAGLRQSDDTIESAGIEKARLKIAEADLLLIIVDQSNTPPPSMTDQRQAKSPHLIVSNKADLTQAPTTQRADINVSALTGQGIDELGQLIVSKLVPRIPDNSQAYPVTNRQINLLSQLAQEKQQ